MILADGSESSRALPRTSLKSLLVIAGTYLVVRRAGVGPAWSFLRKEDHETGHATAGPHRLVGTPPTPASNQSL
jgi:hypothetical protein